VSVVVHSGTIWIPRGGKIRVSIFILTNQDSVTKLEAVMDRVKDEGPPNPPDVNMAEIESCDMLEILKLRHERMDWLDT
jgi:hypothetical protein